MVQTENQDTPSNIKDIMTRRFLEALSENDVMIFEHISSVNPGSYQPETYSAIMCTQGHATCTVEDNQFTINKNDIFISRPNSFIDNAMMSYDFKCCGIVMSQKYFETLLALEGKFWEAGFILQKQPLISLSDEEAEEYIYNFDFLRKKLACSDTPHHKEMKTHLLRSMMFEFYDMIMPKLTITPHRYTSSEVLFRRFMKLVETDTPQQREVGYYANKLCITPKYLSAVCKEVSGKPASTLINDVTSKHIRHLLRTTDLSVKEIATQSGFENLSFFGKYVKRELGMSPREFRFKSK